MINSTPIIQMEGVEVEAGRRTILSIDRLELYAGERVAFIGNSGAGKTTLLRMIKGYVTPSCGRVHVLGESLPIRDRARRRLYHRQIGMIHQQFDLIGRESVRQNVYHGRLGYLPPLRSLLGLYTETDRRLCDHVIEETHLEGKQHRQARTLSGGEQQRVAIARAMAQDPSLLLADEPVSSLDPALAEDILDLLVSLDNLHQFTLLMSLHQPDLAKRYAGRVIAMKGGQVIWDGPATNLTKTKVEEFYERNGPRRGENGEPNGALGHPAPRPGSTEGHALAGS